MFCSGIVQNKSFCLLVWRRQEVAFSWRRWMSLLCWESSTQQLQISPLITVTEQKTNEVPKGGGVLYITLFHYYMIVLGCSDLHLGVAVMHRFHGAPGVVAVVVAAQALGCVHLHRDPAVQVPFSPVCHVGDAGVLLRAALKYRKSRWNGLAEIGPRRGFSRREKDLGVPAVVERALP